MFSDLSSDDDDDISYEFNTASYTLKDCNSHEKASGEDGDDDDDEDDVSSAEIRGAIRLAKLYLA
eukprot:5897165-Karenia_brevis.AAC.1